MFGKKAFVRMLILIVGVVLSFANCDIGEDDDNGNGGDGSSGNPFTVSSKEGWDNVRSIIRSGENNKEYTITIAGNFSIPGSSGMYSNLFGSKYNVKVTMVGNHTISLSSSGYMFLIDSGNTVTIKDITLKGFAANNNMVVYNSGGNFIMQGNSSIVENIGGCGVYMGSGTFTMQDNSSVKNNNSHSNHSGGGVFVGSRSIFTMKDNSSVSGNISTSSGGGGVCLYNVGTFIMQDNSSVSNNSVLNNGYSTGGGGVYLGPGATFTMLGGIISGNNAFGRGGGIYLDGGTFNKTGGIVYGKDEGSNSNISTQGNVIYDRYSFTGYRWRGITAGQNINTADNDFWLND